jgi:predicted Zn finger-like uncharacterized protein
MPISVQCPGCKHGYTLADSQAGKHVRCKSCAITFQVPAVEDVADVLPVEADYQPRRRPPPLLDDRDDEEERRGPRPYAASSGVPVWVWPVVGGGVLLVIIVVVVLVMTLGGGGNKVTPENYNRLHAGMTEAEVRSILGPPTEVVDAKQVFEQHPLFKQAPGFKDNPFVGNFQNMMPKVCTWRHGQNVITVQFLNDRVTTLGSSFFN